MLSRAVIAIVVGVLAGLLTALVGLLLVEVGVETVGAFVRNISWLVGLLVGLYYFFVYSDRRTV